MTITGLTEQGPPAEAAAGVRAPGSPGIAQPCARVHMRVRVRVRVRVRMRMRARVCVCAFLSCQRSPSPLILILSHGVSHIGIHRAWSTESLEEGFDVFFS